MTFSCGGDVRDGCYALPLGEPIERARRVKSGPQRLSSARHEAAEREPSRCTPFQGGIHAYEVFLVPFLIIIVSTMHFGRQCALIAPQMKILRPRAIVVANRAKVQHAAPAQNGWTRRITSSDDLTLNSQRSSQLVIDELQPIWNTFMCSREVHGLGAGSDASTAASVGVINRNI